MTFLGSLFGVYQIGTIQIFRMRYIFEHSVAIFVVGIDIVSSTFALLRLSTCRRCGGRESHQQDEERQDQAGKIPDDVGK